MKKKVNILFVYEDGNAIHGYPIDALELVTPYGNIRMDWEEPAEDMMWHGKNARMFFDVVPVCPEGANIDIDSLYSLATGLEMQVYDGENEICLSEEESVRQVSMIRIMHDNWMIDLSWK